MRYCEKCGAQHPDDARFCPECGSPIANEPTPLPPAPPPPSTPPPALQREKPSSRFALIAAAIGAGALIVAMLAGGWFLFLKDSDDSNGENQVDALAVSDVAVVAQRHISVERYNKLLNTYRSQLNLSSQATLSASEEATAQKQIMTSLIQQAWYEFEADERNIEVSDAEVTKRFESLKNETFPKEDEYETFLANSGQTEQDLLTLVRNSITQEKVRKAATGTASISPEEIEAYFEENRAKFDRPASRDLRIVFNSDEASASQAKSALESGDSWAAVAKQYSEDTATKTDGGKFPEVTKGQFEPTLDGEVFSAQIGELVGPIETQYGYYVFEVTKTNAKKEQTLEQATPEIKQAIESESQQKRFERFEKALKAKWLKRTRCAENYYVSAVCPGQPSTATGTATGG